MTSLLGGPNGVATKLDNLINGYTKTGGLARHHQPGLQSGLTNVAQQQTALKRSWPRTRPR